MPGRDKTGPEGEGPRTGRGLGPCGDGKSRGRGRGLGRGRGRSRGRGFGRGRGLRALLASDILPEEDIEKE